MSVVVRDRGRCTTAGPCPRTPPPTHPVPRPRRTNRHPPCRGSGAAGPSSGSSPSENQIGTTPTAPLLPGGPCRPGVVVARRDGAQRGAGWRRRRSGTRGRLVATRSARATRRWPPRRRGRGRRGPRRAAARPRRPRTPRPRPGRSGRTDDRTGPAPAQHQPRRRHRGWCRRARLRGRGRARWWSGRRSPGPCARGARNHGRPRSAPRPAGISAGAAEPQPTRADAWRHPPHAPGERSQRNTRNRQPFRSGRTGR